jgi:hypothetical protein
VNRVFVSGKTRKAPQVFYTPRGERIITFPLLVDDGRFMIEVVFKDPSGNAETRGKEGSPVMATGELMKSPEKSKAAFRVKAHNIVWMED